MRNAILGGFIGVGLGALVLAACGSGTSPSTEVTQAELEAQVAALQAQIDDLQSQLRPVLGLNYCIATQGTFPSRSLRTGLVAGDEGTALTNDPLLGGIALFAGTFAPRGWAFCEGQLLPVAGNDALFSILGTTYGGDGRTNFALPDLRGRVPMHPDASLRLGDQRN